MQRSEFQIGQEFWTAGGKRWRCTDIGTRTVIAIPIQEGKDPSWYVGPPYAVSETVFDEDDRAGCFLTEEDSFQ